MFDLCNLFLARIQQLISACVLCAETFWIASVVPLSIAQLILTSAAVWPALFAPAHYFGQHFVSISVRISWLLWKSKFFLSRPFFAHRPVLRKYNCARKTKQNNNANLCLPKFYFLLLIACGLFSALEKCKLQMI